MKGLLLWAIRMYQRFLSPRKGYSCAYRVYVGGDGCSGYGYRVINRYGVLHGWALLRRRLDACSHEFRRRQRPLSKQAGSCDVPAVDCGGCDASCGDALDVAECVTSVGDCWPGVRSGRDMPTSSRVDEMRRGYERRRREREANRRGGGDLE